MYVLRSSGLFAHRGVNFLKFVIEYLGEIKTEFENTLPSLSGGPDGLETGTMKKRGSKSRDTLPLSRCYQI